MITVVDHLLKNARKNAPAQFAGLVLLAASLLAGGVLGGCAPTPEQGVTPQRASPPAESTTEASFLIIAHRGASGYRPEHTLAAYQLAIDQGADFIEPDLVPTRDGHLIARHENALAVVKLNSAGELNRSGSIEVLAATTDIAERPEFADRLTVRNIDGRRVGGWFSEDFTLAEIKTLWARERIPKLRPANTTYLRERIPSLQDVLDLTQKPGNTHIGLYPELKHPTHFRYGNRSSDGESTPINIDTAKLLVAALNQSNVLQTRRLFIQCFEVETLRRLRHELLPKPEPGERPWQLVQLFGPMSVTPADIAFHIKTTFTEAALARVYGPLAETLRSRSTYGYGDLADNLQIIAADYANGVGPRKGDTRRLARSSTALGLELHPYTIRAEAFFLSRLRGAVADSVAGELLALREMGATGVFIDQPDLAVSWRALAVPQTAPTP